jgi:signal transduction histidine kinase
MSYSSVNLPTRALTGIIGFAGLLKLSPDTPEFMRADLAYIIASGERAAGLVRQIPDFIRKSIQRLKQFDLPPLIEDWAKFWQQSLSAAIRLSLQIEPGEYLLKTDPAQIRHYSSARWASARR